MESKNPNLQKDKPFPEVFNFIERSWSVFLLLNIRRTDQWRRSFQSTEEDRRTWNYWPGPGKFLHDCRDSPGTRPHLRQKNILSIFQASQRVKKNQIKWRGLEWLTNGAVWSTPSRGTVTLKTLNAFWTASSIQTGAGQTGVVRCAHTYWCLSLAYLLPWTFSFFSVFFIILFRHPESVRLSINLKITWATKKFRNLLCITCCSTTVFMEEYNWSCTLFQGLII